MIRNVTASLKWASTSSALLLAAVLASPALAQQVDTGDETTVGDVALTPFSDLNIVNEEIPPALIEARAAPYAPPDPDSCANIREQIGNIDAVLGEDYDTRSAKERLDMDPGGVAQRMVGWLIPFRGIIREVSGANKSEWELRQAVVAGFMRRAYLKGLGEAKGCPYPARPATSELAAELAEMNPEDAVGFRPADPEVPEEPQVEEPSPPPAIEAIDPGDGL